MRRFGKWVGRLLLAVAVVCAGLWIFGPYEPVDLAPEFDTSAIGDDIDAYFAEREARFEDITPGVEKRVNWAGDAGVRTDWAVLYVHGFSATSQEIRPVPDNVANALGANLVYTRLQGHGRSGEAMGQATVAGWMTDVTEALEAARRVGDKVLVMSTSTGGTLIGAAAADGRSGRMENVQGLIFVSPNFGINNPAAPLLTWPAARYWLPALVGAERGFEPEREDQGTYWTTRYPSVAALPLAALVKEVVQLDLSGTDIPALFWFSDDDQVVVPAATRKFAEGWGGPGL